MKYTNLIGFEKHLLSAAPQNLSPLYLLMVKEENERKLAVSKIKCVFTEQTDAAWISFDAKETQEATIFNELDTYSFLQPKKVVHVAECQNFRKSFFERLEQYFSLAQQGTYLLLSTSDARGNSDFYKKAERHGVILEIGETKPWEKEKHLYEWILQESAKLGKRIHPQAAQLLIKAVGANVLHLLSELNKLCSYVGDRVEILVDDVRAIVCYTHQENGWQLADALFKRNSPLAFRIVRGILAQEVPLFVLLRQLRTQFQTAWHVASVSSWQEIKEMFPQLKDNVVERYKTHVQEYGVQHLGEAIKAIDQVEWMAKNGEDRYDILADFLIYKLITL
ncbi:MAG: DNA polymerase III subunit delta [Parachlamydiaceae bacterium]